MTRLSAAELARRLGQPEPTVEQAAVIEAPMEPGLVVAGAGSGKTETMAARVVWLIANQLVRPERVLGLTFTRKAAGELAARIRHRIHQLAAVHLLDATTMLGGEPTVSTYHAYAGRILAEHGTRLGVEPTARLLSDAVRWQFAARIVQSYDGEMTYARFAPDTVTSDILDLSDEMGEHFLSPDALRRFTEQLIADVHALAPTRGKVEPYAEVLKVLDRQRARLELLPMIERYIASKRAHEAIDYGDQMGVAARLADSVPAIGLIERDRFAAVLLDEYQDTSHSQLVLLRNIFGDGHPVTAVGDPCQSIYGWRGASVGSLQRFPQNFPIVDGTLIPALTPTRELSLSWRNDGRILDLANAVAQPLRADGAEASPAGAARGTAVVPVLRPRPGREEAGRVSCGLLDNDEDEARWVAARLAVIWADNDERERAGQDRLTAAVLTRRRSQQRMLETALRERGVPVEVLGLGGLLDTPEVRDVVSMLRVAVDPNAGDALLRLLSGARWRLGPRDLDALGRRSRRLAWALRADSDRASAATGTSEAPPRPDQEDLGSIVEALDDLGDPAAYSTVGHARLVTFRDELRALRPRLDQPLPDLVADIEATIGLDVEISVRRPGDQALARGHLDAFLDVAAEFAADLGGDAALVPAFLGYLAAAEEQERGLEAGVVERHAGAVQILTVHGAKGLEWDVVAVPGLTKGVFPSRDAGSDVWTTKLAMVPYPLRGDRADLPQWDIPGCAEHKDAEDARKQFRIDCARVGLLEERRLAYVAFTRARSELICSGYWWDDATQPRGPSELLAEVAAHCAAAGAPAAEWVPPPDPDTANPRRAEVRTRVWPHDPLGARRGMVEAAAGLVRAAGAAPTTEVGEWDEEIALLLAERDAAGGDQVDVVLPEHLSVSQLVGLRRDPARLAEQIRRPMPFSPAPLARRGTAFHLWLEQRFGAPRLLDLDELPGSSDAGADDHDLAALQAAFLSSEWADRTPLEVEVPFELRLAGLSLRGRMDAVFLDERGRYEVVDWKTGRAPTGPEADAAAVQLAAYRLAWAELSAQPLERIGAAFHYVRDDRTVRPADLLDAAGLRSLIESIPAE